MTPKDFTVYSARRKLADGKLADRENFIWLDGREYRLELVTKQPESTNLTDRWMERVPIGFPYHHPTLIHQFDLPKVS